ncbi:MAG: cytochrome b/b6 domain-containing protein [Alphaproteobacteria bacterium]|nr:cytochrome b/b6 domain-containing protein [Alphaproteobacteria bacterium]
MSNATAANWALGKRAFHWGLALAVVIALVAPKPEHGAGLVHIMAGTAALAVVLLRLGWRLLGDVRPYVKDAWRLKMPDASKGLRGFAPLLMQVARIGGFIFLALVPVAVGLALGGIGQGEDSPLLEAHEAAGTAIMVLAIAHAVAMVLFTIIIKYNIFGITLFGGAKSFSEGGPNGVWGMVLGAALGLGALVYVWGPFDVASKAAALTEQEAGGGESGEHDD